MKLRYSRVFSLIVLLSALISADANAAPARMLKVKDAFLGWWSTCVLLENEKVKCWGLNRTAQNGQPVSTLIGLLPAEMGDALPVFDFGNERVKDILMQSEMKCFLFHSGKVKCLGSNYKGGLGVGQDVIPKNSYEMKIKDVPFVNLGTGKKAMKIVGAYGSVCALLNDDTVRCWGSNTYGELGINLNRHKYLGKSKDDFGDNLKPVNFGHALRPVDIEGSSTICALFENGRIQCWGYGMNGALGTEQKRFTLGAGANDIPRLLSFVDLGQTTQNTPLKAKKLHSHVHGNHFCAELEDDTIKCWGFNPGGALGIESSHHVGDHLGEMGNNLIPVRLGTTPDLKELVVGGQHNCALFVNGAAKCWGWGLRGALGHEEKSNLGEAPGTMGDFLPYLFLGNGSVIKKIRLGRNHTCAILKDDSLKCWGLNSHGQLGAGRPGNIGLVFGDMGSLQPVDVGTH